mmetsp:Transcript_38793/g.93140  ORF Transcript_38793/g.93140 Transcript_38793/m.93140 type:complete len:768 (+) Transcript_38793:87-2390(+)
MQLTLVATVFAAREHATESIATDAGAPRWQRLSALQERAQELATAALAPEAKVAITQTLIPVVKEQIEGEILKEFKTTQDLLDAKVAELASTTAAAKAAKAHADKEDNELVMCRTEEREEVVASEKCAVDREQAILSKTGSCEAAKAGAEKACALRDAAATVALTKVCTPTSCDIDRDPTCGLKLLATSVEGLQAEARAKTQHHAAMSQNCTSWSTRALEDCEAAEKYEAEDECAESRATVTTKKTTCTTRGSNADIAKCAFGAKLQDKCLDLDEITGLIAMIKGQNRTDTFSESDRKQEWEATQRLLCLLEALRDEGDLSQEAAAECAGKTPYPKEFDYKEAEVEALLEGENFSCLETSVAFSGFKWITGPTAADYSKIDDKPAVKVTQGRAPFQFCPGLVESEENIALAQQAENTPADPSFLGCFKDDTDRDLPHQLKQHGGLTTETEARSLCSALGYQYAGIQHHGEVWCGNEFGKHGKDDTCACGEEHIGAWKQCVYSTKGIPVKQTQVNFLGCFEDKPERDLPVKHKMAGVMATGTQAVTICEANGFAYAGVQHTGEVWCGDKYGSYGPKSDCDCSSTTDIAAWRNCIYTEVKEDAVVDSTFFFGTELPQQHVGILDTGAGFKDHDNGMTYGWNCDGCSRVDYSGGRRGLDRAGGLGLNHFDRDNTCMTSGWFWSDYKPVNWEVQVPNGDYHVTVNFGDETVDSTQRYHSGCQVEGQPACSSGSPCVYDEVVTVLDGRFTVTGFGHDSRECHSLSSVTIKHA